MAIVTNEQSIFLGAAALAGGLVLWYASRKVGAVVEQAIDKGVEAAAKGATSPLQATGPQYWGLPDDATTVGTRGWYEQQITDLRDFMDWRGNQVGPYISPYNGPLDETMQLPGF